MLDPDIARVDKCFKTFLIIFKMFHILREIREHVLSEKTNWPRRAGAVECVGSSLQEISPLDRLVEAGKDLARCIL